MEIKKIAIVGAGVMGTGIAQVFASAEKDVILIDIKKQILIDAIKNIERNLERDFTKGRISLGKKALILNKIVWQVGLNKTLEDVQIVIEATTENNNIKKDIFKQLEKLCLPNTILATNTSSLSITDIASIVQNPKKVIGIHFFNPAPIMELVEVIKGVHTSDSVLEIVKGLIKKVKKTPVEVKDFPGFIVNRTLIPMINEAVFILMEGIASKEDIDKAMKLGANHPLGPLALGDLIGLDICWEIMNTLFKEYGDPKYRPCPLLTQMVRANKLGKKTGEGFYTYSISIRK